MLNLGPTTFELLYRTIAADPESGFRLKRIDSDLRQATPSSEDAREYAHIAVTILSTFDRPYSLALALNTALFASYFEGDLEMAERYFKKIVELSDTLGISVLQLCVRSI
jgi:hypothetical protein